VPSVVNLLRRTVHFGECSVRPVFAEARLLGSEVASKILSGVRDWLTCYGDGEDFLPFHAASSRRIELRRYAGAAL
jgi:hypothetical protein